MQHKQNKYANDVLLSNSMEQCTSSEANNHLVCQVPAFYEIWRFTRSTVFTRAQKWTLSWARWIQSTSSHPISL